MAKISYKDSSLDTSDVYYKTLEASDRYTYSSVRVRKTIFSKKKIKGLTQKSLLPQAKIAWNSLTDLDRENWKNYFSYFFNNGYKPFVKAFIQLRQFGGTGLPVLNDKYLGKVGEISIESPANRIHLQQNHPNYYYVMKKKPKTKSQYIPVRISEFAQFPFYFSISYKSNLVSLSTNYHARLYIRVYTNYQGRVLTFDTVFDLVLISDWFKIIKDIDIPLGTFKGYDFHIDLFDVRGKLYLDNFIIEHSGKNWARDPHFDNMKTTYTRKYYQIEKHYDIIDLPEGASFDSIYYENS